MFDRVKSALSIAMVCLIAMAAFPVSAFAALASSDSGENLLSARHSRSEAAYVTIGELVRANVDYDGAYVVVEGEAVGDIIRGDNADYCWVNLTNNGSTIGVYMSATNAKKVKNLGRYGTKGTTLAVYGVYHVACSEGHEGELDIHADIVEVKKLGGLLEPVPVNRSFAVGALLLVGIGLLLLAVYGYRSRRRN